MAETRVSWWRGSRLSGGFVGVGEEGRARHDLVVELKRARDGGCASFLSFYFLAAPALVWAL
jgi:hypothetical protein